ncbi:MAG: TIGR03905 family TSCPD domain-containing protein [Selenomonadaceae bacterium]|nr:TIGR03905 family TSCPD domain-containing protein [Selenomonadaceae bacterium]
MKSFDYTPQRVCSKKISFDIDDDNKLHNVKFVGGCPGNLLAIGKLVEGKDAKEISEILKGNDCGGRGTSCADQLAIAVEEALKKSA